MGLASAQVAHQAGPANEIGVGWESRRQARAWCIPSCMACARCSMPSSSRTSSATLAAACAGAFRLASRRCSGAGRRRQGGAGQDGAAARQLAFMRKADTLTELAKKMEVDVCAFLATFERYNGASKQGLDKEPEFGKPLKSSKPFDTPPYYAVQILPLARKNFGGAKTDLQCRVLDKHFEPIVGLYAAGEVAGMAGGHI